MREIKRGKRSNRPEFATAQEAYQLYGATLVIGKADRLARDARFLRDHRDTAGKGEVEEVRSWPDHQ